MTDIEACLITFPITFNPNTVFLAIHIRNNLCPLSFIDVPERAYGEGTLGVYELNHVDFLRDLFIWAYERSSRRYLAITQTRAEPDPLRMYYREALIKAVQAIVRDEMLPSAQNIRGQTDELVFEDDSLTFCELVLEAIERLHEGSAVRL